ncbi:2-dehydropantoate 2-reductase [Kineococcus aurantiacus]|uniref:2-dehydropantoate 2-reductase n=3 Tax=Kineococcus aurantiacus TaxID=37633 RepID=A0A7Y9J3C9_9ACTN|nr:2-dehydropantoate 2-reductase [Kineococcus aurantiacus]
MGRTRIAVLGTGANGAAVAADLVRAGLDVTLIDQWPEHVEVMRRDGLTVESEHGSITVPVRAHHLCDVASMRTRFDVVLLVLKAYDTRWGAELVKSVVARDGVVVALQNGMTTADVADVVGTHRTLGAVLEISSTLFTPGVVERHSPRERSWFAVGSVDGATRGREEEVAGVLRHCGTVEVSREILSAKWMKLVLNAAELVPSALLDLSIAEAAHQPGMAELMTRAGLEAVAACRAEGSRLVGIFGLDDVDDARPEDYVRDLVDKLLTDYVRPTTLSTVLQDWRRGRRCEVDEINGRVVATLRAHGAPAPVNEAVVRLAHAVESGTAHRGLHNLRPLLDSAGVGPDRRTVSR